MIPEFLLYRIRFQTLSYVFEILAETIWTVSYTHVDVYKRQHCNLLVYPKLDRTRHQSARFLQRLDFGKKQKLAATLQQLKYFQNRGNR